MKSHNGSVRFTNGDVAWEVRKFPINGDKTGELGVFEFAKDFDFNVKRVFFLRNISTGQGRGFHAHENLKQLVVCLKGSFIMKLDNGSTVEEILMRADNTCLYLDGKVWREMREFSRDAVMVVLCDREYRFDEVVRDYQRFTENLKAAKYVRI